MKILGISSNYHDASATLVIDGKVVASSAEERFTLQKHDPSFPSFSIDFCLNQAKINAEDLDLIVYHEDPINKISRTISSSLKNFPFSLKTFLKSSKEMITTGFWIKREICKKLNVSTEKVIFMPHHLSHAAHAFFTNNYESAAIMTVDAIGEWSSSCIFKATKVNGVFSIEPLDMVPFPHSLGLVYSAFTSFLGFKANDSECSTMALASFGKKTYIDQVKKIIKIKEDDTYEIDISYFDFSDDTKLPLTERFVELFGAPRDFKKPFSFSSFKDLTDQVISPDEIRYADIAASVQSVLEEAVIALARRTKRLTGEENLCYAGGVSLNCVANSKLINANIFKNVYVPPDPGDGGGSMGAALYGALIFDSENLKSEKVSPYLGMEVKLENFQEMVENIDPKEWNRYSKLGLKPIRKENLIIKTFSDENELLEVVASEIANNKIIGWMQGRFENGPRALGNRSILCRPDSIEVAERLSKRVKLRASFRPYACSITNEEAQNIFVEKNWDLGKWMQTSFNVKNEYLPLVRAACHVDHTTRAQICTFDDNPLYYRLLKKLKDKIGLAAVLNTSFNEKGYPIVSTPTHALIMFARTELDILVIGNMMIWKK